MVRECHVENKMMVLQERKLSWFKEVLDMECSEYSSLKI